MLYERLPTHTSGSADSARATIPWGCTQAAMTMSVRIEHSSVPPRYWKAV